MQFSELKLGDIVMMNGTGTNGADVVKWQSRLNKLSYFGQDAYLTKKADPATYHCAIVCRVEKNKVEIAHAVDRGFVRIELEPSVFGEDVGIYKGSRLKIFRCKPCPGLSELAGQIAARWVPDIRKQRVIMGDTYHYGADAYSKRKAIRLFGRSSHYGPGAKKQAALYHTSQDRFVPAKHDDQQVKKMYCSMFVVAAWQAAAGPEASEYVMAKDARYTSPMALEGFLEDSSFWVNLGDLSREWEHQY